MGTVYQKIISGMTDLNSEHVETLMIALHSTLDSLPREAFTETIAFCETMGSDWLAGFHNDTIKPCNEI